LSVAAVPVNTGTVETVFSIQQIRKAMKVIKPLHKVMGPVQPGDWLETHKEPGQTFEEYLHCKPRKPTAQRRKIYIVPIGEFNETQEKIIAKAGEFMGIYYSLPIQRIKTLPLSVIPEKARRVHPTWNNPQILSTYVLHDLLRPKLPADAAVFIAFTSSDLWPGRDWNFVFGQASLKNRVGVWSIYRNGDPEESEEAYKTCLLRTIKTAVHETGHMFSMRHCTAYECCMCGCNHRAESDKRPLAVCPECMAKICWVTGTPPLERYKKLETFCTTHGLSPEAKYYTKTIEKLTNKIQTKGRTQ